MTAVPPMKRRDFVTWVSGAAVAGAFPSLFFGCKSPLLGSKTSSLEAELTFINRYGPITPAALNSASDWLGDHVGFAHRMVRDGDAPQPSTAVRQKAEVVIIGGGMSGLGAAYLLKKKKPVILDVNKNFGGNSRGESWNGVQYSIGAAYLVPPENDHPLMTNFYGPLGVEKQWRVSHDGQIILNGEVRSGFWDGTVSTNPKEKAQIKKIKDYFAAVADGDFPDIPPIEFAGRISASCKKLDRENFLAHLQKKVGKLLPGPRSYIEHYCWSSFGAAANAISAAAGLNFKAGESEGAGVLPGGNAFVTRRLMEELLASGVPEANFKSQAAVTSVVREESHVAVTYTSSDGMTQVIEAERVVIACPKFIAAYIVDNIPKDQAAAMAKLSYNSYVVANLLVDQKMTLDAYDLSLLGDQNETFQSVRKASDHQGVSDVILGHWAQAVLAPSNKSVLTLYRALPYKGGRGPLMADDSFKIFSDAIAAQSPKILKALNVEPNAVKEMRLSRFGHPMVVSAPGLLADGTAEAASRPIDGKIFFCNQDNWALPCIESALGAAMTAVHQMGELTKT